MPSEPAIFPELTLKNILDCQFSSWYPKFSSVSIKSTIVRPLPADFFDYLQSDGVFAPVGSDPHEKSPDSPDESGQMEDSDSESPGAGPSLTFAFPYLDEKIREVIRNYGSVFPKLNWSSPKDAQWILSTTDFMRCTSPADVYLALKASDFIQHDLLPSSAFEGANGAESGKEAISLELVLRKWYAFDRSREVRCFVRNGVFIGACQRDMVFYEFLTSPSTRSTISATLQTFWEQKVREKWGNDSSYVFDLLLTRDLQRAHIVDFNPFAAKTDPLLFTYEELHTIFVSSHEPDFSFKFRAIDSPTNPLVNSNTPQNQHNMVPLDALALSRGRSASDFASALADAIQEANNES